MPRLSRRASSTASRSSSAYVPSSPSPEVRRRRSPAHELDVHVRVRRMDVPKQAAVAVGVVELRIRFELDPLSGRCESLELTARLARVALTVPQLGRVDLHETNAGTGANVESVAVADSRDGCRRPRRLARRSASSQRQGGAGGDRRRCVGGTSDARQLVQPGACCLVLAVRVPREEQETAADDHDRGTEPDSHPDRVEDEDPEHPEQQETRCTHRRA